MAFSDWEEINTGGSHAAALHSTTLPSLPIGGTYCRRLFAYPNNTISHQRGFSVPSSFSGGLFYNTPNTKAIRIEGYIRLTSHSFTSKNAIVVAAKIPSSLSSNYTVPTVLNGYAIGLSANDGNSTTQDVSVFLNGQRIQLMSALLNTWYGVRMEITPIGTAADNIKCYVDTALNGTWVESMNLTIASTDSRYVTWGDNRKIGFSTMTEYGGSSFQAYVDGYIDLVKFSIVNAPTPIP